MKLMNEFSVLTRNLTPRRMINASASSFSFRLEQRAEKRKEVKLVNCDFSHST